MKQLEIIEEAAANQYGSFRRFCLETGQDYSNFKRKLTGNLQKINGWLAPLNLEIKIAPKRNTRGGKK